MNKLKSRKFWVAVAGGLIVILNDGLGLSIPKEAVTNMVYIIASYVLGEGIVDAFGGRK